MKKPQARNKMGAFCYCMISLLVCMVLGYSILASASVTVTEDQSIANKFTRHTVTGITASLPVTPDVTGFIGVSYLTIADIDKNDIKEIIATSGVGPDSDMYKADGEVALFTWDGINKDAWTKTVLNNTFEFPNETIARDMDNDGDIDIVVLDQFFLGSAPGGVYYLKNKGGSITNPSNWEKVTIYQDTSPNVYSYHRAYFVDLDGDGDEDVITTRGIYLTSSAILETLWLENNGDGTYSSHIIGSGGGSLFAMFDVDKDGDLDMVAPQFAITTNPNLSYEVLTTPAGDSLIWYENPGKAALAANHDLAWNRYTIDNWYTSYNPIGKGFEVVVSDVDNDGESELYVSNHNHQNYDTSTPTPKRIWPSGIFYFEIPADPKVTANWVPIKIDTGNPTFVYSTGILRTRFPYNFPEVLADPYAVDRRGASPAGVDQGSPGMIAAGDLTGDARGTDLVVSGDGKGRLYYYEAGAPVDGNLTFKRATLYSDLQCMAADVKVVDLDNDGDLDIVGAIFDTSVAKLYPYTSGSIFFFENTSEPPTLIELTSFDAKGTWGRTRLTWETASETDNAGFNIYRSETAGGEFEKINSALIPAKGSATEGAAYKFVDRNIEKGKTYYYKLEDIDLSGKSTYHGPVSATPWFILSFLK